MSTHRALWKPIVANILLALTGIGLLAIAIKTAVRYVENKSLTVNNCLFFSATKRQENISKVEQSINRIYDSEFCNDLPSVSSPLSAY